MTEEETGCAATASLTEAEAKRMNELADAEFEVEAEEVTCEFDAHGPEVLHCREAQNQFDGEKSVTWWLRWSDDGQREIKVEPECGKPTETGEDATCLLVAGHPGKCDDGIMDENDGSGWVLEYVYDDEVGWLWELREDGALLHDTDLFGREQIKEAQEWAAETMVDQWDVKVVSWERDGLDPDRWTAGIKRVEDLLTEKGVIE